MCRTRAAGASRRVAAALAAGAAAIALVLACAVPARAQGLGLEIQSRSLQPGELVVVSITTPTPVDTLSLTAFGSQWPAYRVGDTAWRGLVGIDLARQPGVYVLAANASGPAALHAQRELKVLPKRFLRRVLKVAPDYVNPPPAVLARITAEADFMRTAYERVSPDPAWRAGVVRPVRTANSSFGSRSVFNGEARSPHAGTDFLSPAGTAVHAPAGGRVVAARDLFFTGNTVIIDHGLGVFSMLAHLSRLDVHEGQEIAQGEVVGLVGATGRVTGPHLHWALRVGAARVDALSALEVLGSGR